MNWTVGDGKREELVVFFGNWLREGRSSVLEK